MSVINRINGPMLSNNLSRLGVDLAFENDLLYIDVNNSRIGIKNNMPTVTLDVNGTVMIGGNLKITGANLASNITNGNINLTPNGSGIVVVTTGLYVSANANVGNLNTNGNVNVVANIIGGNVTANSNIYAPAVNNGNSNVRIAANSNVSVSVAGNSNVFIVTDTGANVTGNLDITGNISANNISTNSMNNGNSNVRIAANANVTISANGVANVLSISEIGIVVTGNANVGNLGSSGAVIASTLTSNVSTGTAPLTVTSTTQVANLNVAVAGNLINGTSNVVVTNNGNITIGSAGNAAILTVTGTGANISGTANVTGNANVGNLGTSTAIITTGNITTINSGLVQNGTSNVTIASGSSISTFIGGNVTAQLVVTSTGANIAGTANVVGNANVGNIGAADAILTSNIKIGGNSIKSSTGNVAITLADKDVTIEGNLDVKGTVTLIESTTITVNDKNVVLGNTASTGAALDGGGIDLGNNALVTFRYNNSTTSWQSNVSLTPTANGTLTLGGTSNYWGNAYVSNLLASGTANIVGNANVGNLGVTQVIATGNITGGNLLTSGSGGNISGANVVLANTFTSNVTTGTAPFVINSTTQVANLNAAVAGSLINGNSNVSIPSANGNVIVSVGGTVNVQVWSTAGANITGTLGVSGNSNVGNLGTNILLATGNVTGANFLTTGNANIGNVYINDRTISTLLTNANLNINANGSGYITLNAAQNSANVVINGSTANLLYVDGVNNSIGVLTNTVPTNVTVKVNSTNSVIMPVGNSVQRPSTPIQAMFRFNTDTLNYEFYDGFGWKQASSTFTVVSADEFIGDGLTSVYTLSQASTTNATLVSVDGNVQVPTTAYTVSSTTLTFNPGYVPGAGTKVDLRALTTSTTVTRISDGDTSVAVTDTGSDGTVTITADGSSRLIANTWINANAAIVSRLAGTSVGAAAVVIDTFDKTLFRSAKYVVQVSNSGRGDYETSEYIATHNGTTAYGTSYGIVYSNVELGNVSVAINSGNVELTYTGNYAGNTVKLFKEYIPV